MQLMIDLEMLINLVHLSTEKKCEEIYIKDLIKKCLLKFVKVLQTVSTI